MNARVEELTVLFRDGDRALLALDRVCLQLRPGQVTALVGESGSGKTTFGKALMGLLPPNAEVRGSIRLDDLEVASLNEAACRSFRWSRVAMVFQNGAANLNPVHRLAEQVAEPLVQRGGMNCRAALELAEKALEEMGLPASLARRYPHELSGGQVQRGLLAMALILDPELLILDEPTAALDAGFKSFVGRLIRDLRNRGKTVLLISHDLDLVRKTADCAAVFYLGQVMEILPAKDLLLAPRHPYTLALGRAFPGLETLRDLGGIRGDAFYRLVHSHPMERGERRAHAHVASGGSQQEERHAVEGGCLFRPRCTQSVDDCRHKDVSMTHLDTHEVRCLRGGIVQILKLEGVAKAYGEVSALRPTDLSVQAGEVLCLVGETGSGKTTLAMIAAGALSPDAGKCRFEDRDMAAWRKADYRSLARKIGIIYQNPEESVSHRFTVFEMVAEPLRIHREYSNGELLRQRVLEVLADVHLPTGEDFLGRYAHELNMGAIQRICIARALALSPVLLVADEPTSALDPSVQAKVLKMLLHLQVEKGLSLIFVTHDLGLARKVADRVGVMLSGQLVELGPAARVLGDAVHPYTRFLLKAAGGEACEPVGTGGREPGGSGCPFRSRCSLARESCSLEPIVPVQLNGAGHMVWCPLPNNAESSFTRESSQGVRHESCSS